MGTGAVFSGPYQPQPFAPSPFQQPMRGFGGVPLQQSPAEYALGREDHPHYPGDDPLY
jgi:hypothetical protein